MQRPLKIFIVGTTAVGKTKLSIELSKAFGGEVVNSDAKQLYKYANIMTAKASQQEMENIPHHMLDCIEPEQVSFNRNRYFLMAQKQIEGIQDRGKIPIIVGGTNYYVQTLLYNMDIKESDAEEDGGVTPDQKQQNEKKGNKKITELEISSMNKQEKYQSLKQVDPVLARKLHPNDDARITSFLTRYAKTGIPPSNNYRPYSHALRDPNTILFWLKNSNKEELRGLMSKRIIKMLKEGGLHEIIAIFQYARVHGMKKVGVLLSIGYQQFQEFYDTTARPLFTEQDDQKLNYNQIFELTSEKMPQLQKYLQNIEHKIIPESPEQQKITKILQKSLEQLQKNTVNYSKRQITWIRNRIFSSQNEDNRKHFFVLELAGMGDLYERFDTQIKEKAIEIIQKIQEEDFGAVVEKSEHFVERKLEGLNEWKKYYCERCEVEVNGKNQWEIHLKSRKHKGIISKKERKAQKIKEKRKNKEKIDSIKNKEDEDADKEAQEKQENEGKDKEKK